MRCTGAISLTYSILSVVLQVLHHNLQDLRHPVISIVIHQQLYRHFKYLWNAELVHLFVLRSNHKELVNHFVQTVCAVNIPNLVYCYLSNFELASYVTACILCDELPFL